MAGRKEARAARYDAAIDWYSGQALQADIGVLASDGARDYRSANGHARRQAFALLEPRTALRGTQAAQVTTVRKKRLHGEAFGSMALVGFLELRS